LAELVTASGRVGATRSRSRKIDALADALRAAQLDEVRIVVAILSGEVRQGKIGIGFATLQAVAPAPAAEASLSVAEVDRVMEEMSSVSGPGSGAERARLLEGLLSAATEEEQAFLRAVLAGDLRQGALEGLLTEAAAAAAGVGGDSIRRAVMLSGDLGEVAEAALVGGAEALGRFRLRVFCPVQPMLAQTAPSAAAAVAGGAASVEAKLDGARIQVHRRGDDVRVYTRNLRDVTEAVPEVVDAIRRFDADPLVLDGEVLALDAAGRPRPFQVTMSRFGRRLEVAEMRRSVPLSPVFFDCLHRSGEDLIDRPLRERWAVLEESLPVGFLVHRTVTGDGDEAEAFLQAALAEGHEGVVVKALESTYEAGRRGSAWLKVKPAHTLDLVVLAAEWGSGRRRGRLSNLHLGAYDPESGSFVMLGKTFKGLTDEMLEWQTSRLLELAVSRGDWVVEVRPELVVEVAFDGVQASGRYPGGMALRFARVKAFREDKRPEEADTVATVRAILEGSGDHAH
jgi:DNA ligase-1